MSDVWLETKSGLVRADAIVAVEAVKGRLKVRLATTTGGEQGIGGWAVGMAEVVVCDLHSDDGARAPRVLVEEIAARRTRGEAGIVVVGERATLSFDAFE